jgi:hypothetical protein
MRHELGAQQRNAWRRPLAALLCLLVLGIAACGSATLRNDEIIRVLELSKPENRDTYVVAGDPFCEIRRELLGTKDRVDAARASKRKRRLMVTNPTKTAGVIGIPPFGGSCKQRVVSGLQSIDAG